jgi:hypothetical protein
VPEQPDGASCTDDIECASGRCYADSHVCGAPRMNGEACVEAGDCVSDTCLSDGLCGDARPIGGDCRVDADCATSNCSTNGDETRVGQCMMALGEVCDASSPCERCRTSTGGAPLGGFETGRCFRSGCDPSDAPNCPRFDRHTFSCARSVEGTYHCYEECTADPATGRTDDHDCWDSLGFCDGGRMFCR